METLVNSLLSQTYRNQEIIISDDCSCDGTDMYLLSRLPELMKVFPRVEVHLQDKNLGLSGRNNIRFVSGRISPEAQYVQILEGDDYFLDEKTSREVAYLESHPEAGAVHSDFILIQDGHAYPRAWLSRWGTPYMPSGNIYDTLLTANKVLMCTAMWRADIYKRAFDYDLFTQHGIILGDYAGTLRAAREAEIHYIEDSLSAYRWHKESTVNNPATRPQIISDTHKVQDLVRRGVL